MKNNIITRRATPADAVHIALLARVTFTESFGQYFRDQQDLPEYYDSAFAVARITSSIEKENNIFLLAFYNDLPIGFTKIKKCSPSPFIKGIQVSQLQKIYVLKEFISKGVGQLLMDELVFVLKELNSKFIWLSVFVENERAYNFYRRNGFTPAGEHTFQIGKEVFDFLVMKKELVKSPEVSLVW